MRTGLPWGTGINHHAVRSSLMSPASPLDLVLHAHARVADARELQRHRERIAVAAHAQELGLQVHDGHAGAAGDQLVLRKADMRQEVFLHLMQQVKELRVKDDAGRVAMVEADRVLGTVNFMAGAA